MTLIGIDLHYAPPARPAVLTGVSIDLPKGAFLGIGGKSGAGKSTLGRILSGHTLPTGGRVDIDGQSVIRKGQPRVVQYAPQSPEFAVDPRWSIGRILKNGAEPDPDVLDALGVLSSWGCRYPAELSGGQLQRVSLARLLGRETQYLICDEITAQLDALSQKELWDRLTDICRRRGIGLLIISHDVALRQWVAERSVMLENGVLT